MNHDTRPLAGGDGSGDADKGWLIEDLGLFHGDPEPPVEPAHLDEADTQEIEETKGSAAATVHQGSIRAPRARRSRGRITLRVFGVLAILAGISLVTNLFVYKHAAAQDADSLRAQLAREAAAANQGATCTAPPPSAPIKADGPRMLLTIPSIGLNVPVLDGTADSILDVGAGHVPASNWPDQGGTDVLAAHNVTFFNRLPDVKTGDVITLSAPCRTWTYRVTSGEVVNSRLSLPQTPTPTLDLYTCWPISSLINTNKRYMISAELVSAALNTVHAMASTAVPGPTWTPTLPPELAGVDLSANANGITTGHLATTGTPSGTWAGSTASLNAEGTAANLFAATLRAASDGHASWWSTLAPGVPRTAIAPLLAPGKISVPQPVNFVVSVTADTLNSVTITGPITVGTTTYQTTVTMGVQGDEMSITGWKMTGATHAPAVSTHTAAPTTKSPVKATGTSAPPPPVTTTAATSSAPETTLPPYTPPASASPPSVPARGDSGTGTGVTGSTGVGNPDARSKATVAARGPAAP